VRVLAVDTTTSRGSLAVVEDDDVRAEVRLETADGHSRWLLAAAESVLGGLALDAAALDGFAVAVGPGSFTGLRVGIASVQGLALASGRPVVGLSSLDVLGFLGKGAAPTVVSVMEAFRQEVFAAVYDGEGRLRGERRVGLLEDLLEGVEGDVAFVGAGAGAYRPRIEARVPGARFPEVDLFLAAGLGRAAASRLRRGEGCRPGELRPMYLRGADLRKPRS